MRQKFAVILWHLFLLYFLFMTAYAFIYTMSRVQIFPFIPWVVLRYHYGMMAPYQGYSTDNADLLAEGLKEGAWQRIDLDPYYPMILGNRIMYRRLRSFSFLEPDVHQKKYGELAKKLLEIENEKGERYESVRLTWQEWPMSVEGWDARRTPEETTDYPIITIP